jgi:hypothetical protein
VLNRIFDGLDSHLTRKGSACLVGDALGNKDGPFFIKRLEELALHHRWSVNLILHGPPTNRVPILVYLRKIAALTLPDQTDEGKREIVDRWNVSYERIGAEYTYTFTLKIKKTNSHHEVNILRLYNPWNKEDVPCLSNDVSFRSLPPSVGIFKGENLLFTIKPETFDFLRLCNDKANVESIVKEIFPKYSINYKDMSIAISDALDKCHFFEQKGVITRKKY